MNIIIIGLGSMGKRRLRLIKNHFHNLNIYGVDSDDSRRIECEKCFHIKTFKQLDEVDFTDINCAFICTPPLSHNKIINICLNRSIHVFTELNLVKDGYIDNIELALKKKVILFLSSTALYRKEINYIIKELASHEKAMLYNYHVGQYLPDWHPWENYKDFFVNEKRTNGCREILAIELPWIIAAFGKISDINVKSGKISNLNLEYNDYYMIQITHESGSKGSMMVDVISREGVRKLEIINEEIYIDWQGKPDTLKRKSLATNELENVELYDSIDTLEGYSSTIVENQYLEEMINFFDTIKGIKEPKYTFYDDLYTLGIIDRIEGLM